MATGKLSNFKKETLSFFYTVFTLLFLISIFTHDPDDPSFFNSGLSDSVNNYIGIVGAYISFLFFYLFGKVSFLIPIIFIYIILKNYMSNIIYTTVSKIIRMLLMTILLLSLCGLLSQYDISLGDDTNNLSGGIIGLYLSEILMSFFGMTGSILIMSFIFLFSSIKFFDLSLQIIALKISNLLKYSYLKLRFHFMQAIDKYKLMKEKIKDRKNLSNLLKKTDDAGTPSQVQIPDIRQHTSKREFKEKQTELFSNSSNSSLPLLEFLIQHPNDESSYDENSLQLMSDLLKSNLSDFNIDIEVQGIKPGPVVTLFEIIPAKGIKVKQIVDLSKDLARTMSVTSLRVVENIPGTTAIGIEIPNDSRELVSLREIIISKEYEKSKSHLTLALGKDIQGNPVCTDLQKLPHLLVAGTTGSGKSVSLHTMLISLLYKSNASDLKMLLIDPKMLELNVYNDIPHLLNPVITDMENASAGLRWCVQQMDKRYRLMSELGARDIKQYNKILLEKGNIEQNHLNPNDDTLNYHTKLPYIVVVIDEFADMILTVGKKVEDLIIRLAQKARAAGIHLILATQRPSVNVITGIIKANIPARAALQVTTNIDSRTIIDSMGAENLLGNGDMLFMSPNSRILQRVHGAYISDEEIKNIVGYIKKNNEANYIESLLSASTEESEVVDIESNDDPLYSDAVSIVLETRKSSISFLQRKLRIGYNRAANLIDTMEAKGLLSAPQPNGTREILTTEKT